MSNKIPICSKDSNVYNFYKQLQDRALDKNEFQIMALYGRAGAFCKIYRIETAKIKDDLNYNIYFYDKKSSKLVKKLKIINGHCWDLNYKNTHKKKQVDMYNSAYLLAFIMEKREHGIPYSHWIPVSKLCKIRPY